MGYEKIRQPLPDPRGGYLQKACGEKVWKGKAEKGEKEEKSKDKGIVKVNGEKMQVVQKPKATRLTEK